LEVFQAINYILNILIVFNGKYKNHHHLHLETLYLFSIILFLEFIQSATTDDHFHNHAVFIYYNIKLALVIYEVYVDQPWTEIFEKIEVEKIMIFIWFLGSKLMKQFYYTTPYDFRSSAIFWILYIVGGCILEPLSLIYMLWHG